MSAERDIDKVLAALGRAEVPEGLEARVAEGLERRGAARVVEFGSGVWWRGALAGFAAAMLVVGVVMLAGHLVRGRGAEGVVRVVAPSARVGGVRSVAAREDRREPCADGSARHVAGGAGAGRGGVWRGEMMRVERMTPSRPFVAPPLTAQEQALVRVVRASDPKELAMLNPEVRERQEAEEAAQFQRFFAEPPSIKPVAPDARAQTAATVVGGPGLATRGGEPSVAEPNAAESSIETASGEDR